MKTLLLFLSTLFAATLNAQIVNIPDPNFKAALLDHDPAIDTNGDGDIQYIEAEAVTVLDVSNAWTPSVAISDLTGIEAFVNLVELNCFDNNLTTLDLSQNTTLEILDCSYNQLTFLNITQNIFLKELNCYYNQLTNLNITQNINLEILHCYNNHLTNVDVSQNINIESISIQGNNLTAIDISHNNLLQFLHIENNNISNLNVAQNTGLITLTCENNLISILDLTQNPNLEYIRVKNNQLQNLNLRNGNNANITYFNTENNPDLTCIFVDDANYSANNPDWFEDTSSTYVETQQQCDDLAGIADFGLQQIKIYPNPVKDILEINSEFRIQNSELVILDISGKKVYQISISTNPIKINLSFLPRGIYFLNINKNQTKILTKKIIKL